MKTVATSLSNSFSQRKTWNEMKFLFLFKDWKDKHIFVLLRKPVEDGKSVAGYLRKLVGDPEP